MSLLIQAEKERGSKVINLKDILFFVLCKIINLILLVAYVSCSEGKAKNLSAIDSFIDSQECVLV